MDDYTTRPSVDARRPGVAALVGLTAVLAGAALPGTAAATTTMAAVSSLRAAGRMGAQEVQEDIQRARELFARALEQARSGDLEAALETAERGIGLDPDDPDGLNLLGQIHEGLGHRVEARDAYERAIAADPEFAQPRVNLAVLELRAERYEAALGPLDDALELTPDDPRLHAFRGVALRNVGRLGESLEAFERAWELAPDNGELALDVSVASDLTGDRRGALDAVERAVRLAPDLLEARLQLARLLASSDREEDLVRAPGAYRDALERAPDVAQIWLRLADAYERLAMHADAETALRKALQLGARGADVQMSLARVLHAQKKYEESAEAFARAAELDPDLGDAWFLRSEALMNLDRSDEALEALERAAAVAPDDPRPRLAAAQILLQRGDLEGMESQVEAAAATGRERGRVELARGRLRQRQGRIDEAIEALQAAVAADPGLLEARYLLGQCLAQDGRTEEGREVLAEYQRRLGEQRRQEVAVERANSSTRARIHGVRARVYLAEERFDDAVAQLEAAVALTPEDPAPWRLLVSAYEALGRQDDADRARARLAEIEGPATGDRSPSRDVPADAPCLPLPGAA